MKDLSEHEPACGDISSALLRIGDKWSMLIITLLKHGTRRFGEIRRLVPSISQRMLTLSLRGLERDGLVKRTLHPSVPPRVDYELTPLGHSLSEPIAALGIWAKAHVHEITAARRAFDALPDAG